MSDAAVECLAHGTDYQECPACWRAERNALKARLASAEEQHSWLNKYVGYLRDEAHRWEKTFQGETLRTSALTREVETLKAVIEQARQTIDNMLGHFDGCEPDSDVRPGSVTDAEYQAWRLTLAALTSAAGVKKHIPCNCQQPCGCP